MIDSNSELALVKYRVLECIANRSASTKEELGEFLGLPDLTISRILLSLVKDKRIACISGRFVLVRHV